MAAIITPAVSLFTGWRRREGGHPRETDDFSYNIVRDPVEVHDLNATILHLWDRTHRLTFKFRPRFPVDRRTGMKEILA